MTCRSSRSQLPDRQRCHRGVLLGEAIDRASAQRLVRPLVGFGETRVELQLEVEVVGEPTAGHEVRLDASLQSLNHPLRVRLRLRLMALLGSELFV